MYTGIRWDEHNARERETYFSQHHNPNHVRIHPILHFKEFDVWETVFDLKIPFCKLYYEGYRSLGSKSGTVKTTDTPAWEQDLTQSSERQGRSLEKEKVMQALRELGYL